MGKRATDFRSYRIISTGTSVYDATIVGSSGDPGSKGCFGTLEHAKDTLLRRMLVVNDVRLASWKEGTAATGRIRRLNVTTIRTQGDH